MKLNEWGVQPGTQDNIMPGDLHKLSEMECDLVNLFRALPVERGREFLQMLMTAAMKEV